MLVTGKESRSPRLNRLRSGWSERTEKGAGGLLPIIVIGLIIVIVAGSIAASTSFAAKISRAQVDETSQSIEARSLLNLFLANIQISSLPAATGSNAQSGSYKLYYSTAVTKPSTSRDSGVVAVSGSGALPTTVKWLVVDLITKTSGTQTAVYSYARKGGPTLDSAVSWTGTARLTNSNVRAAPGVEGAISVVARETATTATGQTLNLSASDVAANTYATYTSTNAVTTVNGTTIRGLLTSKAKITISSGNSPIYGDVTSGSTVATLPTTYGTTTQNTTNRPTAPGTTTFRYGIPGAAVTLAATDCSTAAKLKARLELITAASNVNVDNCSAYPTSWATEIKPKANIVISSTKSLPISNLKVTGNAGTLGFYSTVGTSFTGVNYSNGAAGQFLSQGSMSITDSTLSGSVGNAGTTGSTLEITRSTVLYTPVEAPNNCTSSGTCSAWVSTAVHLVRAS